MVVSVEISPFFDIINKCNIKKEASSFPQGCRQWDKRSIHRGASRSEGSVVGYEEQDIVYGKNAVGELLASGSAVDTVYLSESLAEGTASYYTALRCV